MWLLVEAVVKLFQGLGCQVDYCSGPSGGSNGLSMPLCPRAMYAGTCVGSYGQIDSWAFRWFSQMLVVTSVDQAGGKVPGPLGSQCGMGNGSSNSRMILCVQSYAH